MRINTAAALVAAGMLLQACTGHDGRWDMDGDGHRDHRHPGGGKPGPLANVQHLAPVTIQGVKPSADPKQRFSLGVCEQGTCNLTVDVDASCNITLDPQYMGLRFTHPSMDFALVYTLRSANGHQFDAAVPIDWKRLGGGSSAPDVHVDSKTQVTVTYSNVQQARRFLYGIVVDDASGKPCGELDPGVIPDL